jgi:hypothetical protein
MPIKLNQRVQVAILLHPCEVEVLVIGEQAPHIIRRIGADHYYWADAEAEGVLHLAILGVEQFQELGFELMEPLQLDWRQLTFRDEVGFAL